MDVALQDGRDVTGWTRSAQVWLPGKKSPSPLGSLKSRQVLTTLMKGHSMSTLNNEHGSVRGEFYCSMVHFQCQSICKEIFIIQFSCKYPLVWEG